MVHGHKSINTDFWINKNNDDISTLGEWRRDGCGIR